MGKLKPKIKVGRILKHKAMSNNKEHYHNEAQKDAPKYEPPHTLLDGMLAFRKDSIEKIIEENRAYKEGYSNAMKQKK